MKIYRLSEFVPTITYYDYHERKSKFLLYEDRYAEWAIFAIEEGVIYYEIGGRKGTAAFGDLLLCPPGIVFRRVVVEPVRLHFIRVTWEHEQGADVDPASVLPYGKITLQGTERLAANYAVQRSMPVVSTFVQDRRRNHFFRDIWYAYCLEEETVDSGSPAAARQKADELMKQAEKRIRHRAFERFELRQIAEELHISPAQLTKRFQASFEQTPTNYLTRLRLEKARSLLTETYLTVDQIAQCCGYENGFYLSRIFTKQLRMPPTEYRSTYRI